MNFEQILGAAGSIGGTILANSNPVGKFLGMSNPVAGAIISGLGSLFGSSGSNKDSLKSQKELVAYQSQLDQEKWLERFNLQNEYNLPSAARKRIEDAGLNPNLMYGSLSGNLAAANPSTNTPSGQLSKYMAIQEAMQFNKQLEVSDSVIKKNEAEAEKAYAQAKREQTGNERDKFEFSRQLEYYQSGAWMRELLANADIAENTVAEIQSRVQVNDANFMNLLKDLDVKDANISNIRSQTDLNYAKAEEIAQMLEISWQRLNLDKEIGYWKMKEMASAVALNGAMQGLYNSETQTQNYINKFLPSKLTNEVNLQMKEIQQAGEQLSILKEQAHRNKIKNFHGKGWKNHVAGALLNIADVFGAGLNMVISKGNYKSNNVTRSTSTSQSTNTNYNHSYKHGGD